MNCEEIAAEHIINEITENIDDFDLAVKYTENQYKIQYEVAVKLYNVFINKGLQALRDEAENVFSRTFSDEELYGDNNA